VPRQHAQVKWITAELKSILNEEWNWSYVRSYEEVTENGDVYEKNDRELALAKDVSNYIKKCQYEIEVLHEEIYPLLVRVLRNNNEARDGFFFEQYKQLMHERPELAIELLGRYLPELGEKLKHETSYNNRTTRLFSAISALYNGEIGVEIKQNAMSDLARILYDNFKSEPQKLKEFLNAFSDIPSGYIILQWKAFEKDLRKKLKQIKDSEFLDALENPEKKHFFINQLTTLLMHISWQKIKDIKICCTEILGLNILELDSTEILSMNKSSSKQYVLAVVIRVLMTKNKLKQVELVKILNAGFRGLSHEEVMESPSLLKAVSSKEVCALLRQGEMDVKTLKQQPCFKKMPFEKMLDMLLKEGREDDSQLIKDLEPPKILLQELSTTVIENESLNNIHRVKQEKSSAELNVIHCAQSQSALLSERTSLSSTLPEFQVATPSKAANSIGYVRSALTCTGLTFAAVSFCRFFSATRSAKIYSSFDPQQNQDRQELLDASNTASSDKNEKAQGDSFFSVLAKNKKIFDTYFVSVDNMDEGRLSSDEVSTIVYCARS